MRRSIEVDTRRLPFVLTTVRGAMQVEDVEEMQRQFEALFASRRRFVTITDARAMTRIPAAPLRRAIADWNVRYRDETATYNVAGVAILDSVLGRAALRAIHWIAPHPSPYVVVASPAEAVAVAFEHLEGARIELPQGVHLEELMRAFHGPAAGRAGVG